MLQCVAILAICGPAAADGCFMGTRELVKVGESHSLVASPKQEAILATDGKIVQVVLRTHFRAGPEQLAWVVPVPQRPTDIGAADDSVFGKLDAVTAPRFFKVTYSSHQEFHIGCGGAASPGMRSTEPLAVRVEETGRAGMFDYTVLAADDSGALVTWLNDNNYQVPANSAEVFKHYTKDGWHWLAMKVRVEAGDKKTLAPHPITYRFASDRLIYPLVISQLSADKENEIVLYIVGQSRYRCANWDNMDINAIAVEPGEHGEYGRRLIREKPSSPSGTDYEDVFREKAKASGHLFVTEFAKTWEIFGQRGAGRRIDDVIDAALLDNLNLSGRQTVTRLRAFVPAQRMDRDVELTLLRPSGVYLRGRLLYAEVDNQVELAGTTVSPAPPHHASTAGLGVIAALGIAFMLGGRGRLARGAKLACLAIACVALAI
jgi:hypothetical protein